MGKYADLFDSPTQAGKYSDLFDAPMGAGATARADYPLGAPTPPSRMEEGFQVLGEATGIPSFHRVIDAATDPEKDVSKLDLLSLAFLGAGGAGARLGGATAKSIGKGMGKGAVGAAAGQALLGQEARGLGEMIRGEDDDSKIRRALALAVEIAPSIVGGVAGPALASKAGAKVRGGISSAAPESPILQAIAKKTLPDPGAQPQGFGNISRTQHSDILKGLQNSEYVTPEILKKVEIIEKRIGQKLTPGQIEYLAKGQLSDSPLLDVEYGLSRTQPAMETYSKQAAGLEKSMVKKGSSLAKGYEGQEPTQLGSDIQADTFSKMKTASKKQKELSRMLEEHPDASLPNPEFSGNVAKYLQDFLKHKRVGDTGIADIGLDEISLVNQFLEHAPRIQNLRDALAFKRNIVAPQIDKAFEKLGKGSGKAADTFKAQIYQVVDSAIQDAGITPKMQPLMAQYNEAAGAWSRIKSPEFKSVKNLAGVKGSHMLPSKDPTKVVSDIISGQKMGLIPQLEEAAKSGLVDMNKIRQAAYSEFMRKALGASGKIDLQAPGTLERVRNSWNAMTPQARQTLFGTQSIDDVLGDISVLTSPFRYAPNHSGTARAKTVLDRGTNLLSKVPWVGKGAAEAIQGAKGIMEGGKASSFFEGDSYRPKAAPSKLGKVADTLDVVSEAGLAGTASAREAAKERAKRLAEKAREKR